VRVRVTRGCSTFDHLAEVIIRFTEGMGLTRYSLYMQDYGGPVGFRMALAHPRQLDSLIVQNAVAHNDGLGALWKPRLPVIWGKYDPSFDRSEPEADRRDVPNAQVHVLDACHFALDTAADEIAALVREFLASSL
jgi:pimeloyl-ACP methyl ester carboxylesterase